MREKLKKRKKRNAKKRRIRTVGLLRLPSPMKERAGEGY